MRNLWVWLHWVYLAERTAEGRRLHLERLPLRCLTSWLIQILKSQPVHSSQHRNALTAAK